MSRAELIFLLLSTREVHWPKVLHLPCQQHTCTKKNSHCHSLAPLPQGVSGYAELLYSITDNDQLFRDGSLKPTNNFISSMTQVVQPIAAITGRGSDKDHILKRLE